MNKSTTTSKTHWKKAFNKDYLGAWDFDEDEDKKVVIEFVGVGEVKGHGGTVQTCNIAHFADKKLKPMVLNDTNCKMVRKFAGSPYIEDWRGIAVQLYVDHNVRAFGEITEGIRIREMQPRMEKDSLTPKHPKWQDAAARLKSVIDTGGDDELGAFWHATRKHYVLTDENERRLRDAANAL